MLTETIYEHLKDLYHSKITSYEKAVIVEPTESVSKTINKITKTGAYDVFYKEGKNVFGTNVRSLLASKDISDMKAEPFFSSVPFLSTQDSINKAAHIMAHYRIRTVPVVEHKEIIGAIGAKTILKLLAKKDSKWITASLLFTPNPISLSSGDSLSTARKLMTSKRIDHIPIISKNVIRQVLTSFHLLQSINPQESLGRKSIGMRKIRKLESPIGNIGSTRIPQCLPKTGLNSIIDTMLKTNTTCTLVTLWDNLHGIITYRDILSLLAAKIENEIPLYIVGMPSDEASYDVIKNKFTKALKRLQKVYSEIQEARVSIKRQHTRGSRQLYEVSIRITTPYKTLSHKESGWDLSQIFDILNQRLLRSLSKRAKRRYKTSIRKIGLPIDEL